MWGLTTVTPPAVEPLNTDEVKLHLRYSVNFEDRLIDALITAARQYCEVRVGKSLITQTLRLTRDQFPYFYRHAYDGPGFYQWGFGGLSGGELRLPRGPVQSVTNIQYVNMQGATITVSSSIYAVDLTPETPRIMLKWGQIWPTDVLWQGSSVTVNYVAGYTTPALVPQTIKQAMLLLIGSWFSNREAVGNVGGRVELAVDALLGSAWSGEMASDFG